MSLEPPAYQPLDAATNDKMLALFHGERNGWVQVGEKKWLFPHRYVQQGKHFYNFKPRPNDTWVLSFPRSGTTWTQELVWLIANDLDFATARKYQLTQRFPFLEYVIRTDREILGIAGPMINLRYYFRMSLCTHPQVMEEVVDAVKDKPELVARCRQLAEPGYEAVERLPSPRFIKSHFPFSLLPSILDVGCKVVYVARNPKDVAVSWFHLNRLFVTQGYQGDFQTFWNLFQNDNTLWCPYWEHLKEAWALRDHPNMLFLFYEDMNMDLPGTVKKVANFLGRNLSHEQIFKLVDYLDFNNFKKNPTVNGEDLKKCGVITSTNFIRKGQSGGWIDSFTPELEKQADKWIAENLQDTDLSFPILNNNTM